MTPATEQEIAVSIIKCIGIVLLALACGVAAVIEEFTP